MSSPEAVVRERVAKWRPILLSSGNLKDVFEAGRAEVSADIRTGLPGDVNQGISAFEKRLVDAVNAAQASHLVTEVRVSPDEKFGLNAVAKVAGHDEETRKEEHDE